ncbi:DUF3348 family protein [Ramlibacter sp. USB13]|uniref:DUF3348 family protein n=1 Tax=Ramlibacter cellulosilyticus TaxID=2764187 RepID=A0A923S9D2_9BURK|nr:DUF3348 family protein [Ramlibacter cellulosilyticus]MBC5781540.1 DUF3348 family protein [Ramlibacter cellulosilyticus]
MRNTPARSALVRHFGGWVSVDAEPAGMDFAERLSLWLNAFDAIHLQAAHQAIRSVPPAAPVRRGAGRADLAEDFRQARGVLANAIARDPLADLDATEKAEAGYAPWQRRHQELQRQMEQMVGALRDHARQTLLRGSPRMRQLAALDAAMEQLLARREEALLPKTIALLARRFADLRAADDGSGAWRAAFERDWRQALLTELDLRLEPIAGLVDAQRNEGNNPR